MISENTPEDWLASLDEWHFHSLSKGLTPPDEKSEQFFNQYTCGHLHAKRTAPSSIELDFMGKKHRLLEMQKVSQDFIKDAAKLLTEKESDILRLMRLPSIEEIREDMAAEEPRQSDEKFEWTQAKSAGLTRIVLEWQFTFLGDNDLYKEQKEQKSLIANPRELYKFYLDKYSTRRVIGKQLPSDLKDLSIYQFHMLTANSIGLEKTIDEIIKEVERNFPEDEWEIRKNYILEHRVLPNLENDYLKAMIKSGGDRIRSHLARHHIGFVKSVLRGMAKQGNNPWEAARFLHKEIGEGNLWYWVRITRSEPVLAYNAAFDGMCQRAGINYEQWSALGNACALCASLDGKVWRVGEGPEPCVMGSCKIVTINGWESIKNIKINDLVLTHQGKFKRVTKTYRRKALNQRMIKIHYKNIPYTEKRKITKPIVLELTDNHPVYIEGKFIVAGGLKKGDKIRMLATRCPVCNKLMPYTRWRNGKGEKANFCSLKCSDKVMDNWVHRLKEETAEIRKKISDFKKENNPMHQSEYRKKMVKSQIERLKNPEIRKRMSKSRIKFHNENPDFTKNAYKKWKKEKPEQYKSAKKKQAKNLSKYYQEHPGLASEIQKKWQKENPDKYKEVLKKAAKTLASNNWISQPQRELYELIKQYYNEAELNLPIETNIGMRFGDVVLPQKRIILEYDGEYWHQDKDKELQRDLELQFSGWTVLHFTRENWQEAPEQVERLLKNHDGEYEFIDMEIFDIQDEIKKSVFVYNLEVAEDQTYLAKGIVVHNCTDTHPYCYCMRTPLYSTDQPVMARYDQPSPYERRE